MVAWTPLRVLFAMLLGGPSAHLLFCAVKVLTAQSPDFAFGNLHQIIAMLICWLVITALTFSITYQALSEEATRVTTEKKSTLPVYFKAYEAAFLLELVFHIFH